MLHNSGHGQRGLTKYTHTQRERERVMMTALSHSAMVLVPGPRQYSCCYCCYGIILTTRILPLGPSKRRHVRMLARSWQQELYSFIRHEFSSQKAC